MKREALLIFCFALLNIIGFVSAQCTDSDNGVNYYAKGQVIVSENGTSLSYNDACVYKLEGTNEQFYVNYFGELYNNIEKCSGDNCYVAEAFCENNAKKWTVKICLNGCSDGKCLCPTTKCSDGTVYGPEKCKVKNNICICPSCPAVVKPCSIPTCAGVKDTGNKDSDGCTIYECPTIALCSDSDGGQNYYVKGITIGKHLVDGDIKHEDVCETNTLLFEAYCSGDNQLVEYDRYVCPQGCSAGACISEGKIKEQVTCLFANSNQEQKCYTAYENERAYCSGKEICTAIILGYAGEQITWKSSCGGYAYTTIDGNNEYAKFDCSEKISCKDSDDGKDIYRKGVISGLDWGSNNQVEKEDYCITEGEKSGRLAEYFCQYSNGVFRVASETFGPEDGCYDCKNGACRQIIVKPMCGNGICESGEGEVCVVPSEKKVLCEQGKECKASPAVCKVVCPQDCKKTEGIYAKLNEKFKLQVYQPVKITENETHLMKITFKDLIAYKCQEIETTKTKKIEERATVAQASITGKVIKETSSAGECPAGSTCQAPTKIMKCVGAGPKALLDVDMIKNNELGKHSVVNLDVGEKKQVDGFTISFLGYDYASRTGTFLVNRESFSCEKGCKCDENGKIIECSEKCGEGETLCSDGKCREKCNIVNFTEECKYGCLYEGKCFPMGVRSKGLYCNTDLIMDSQLNADEACDNNFECSSNVCVSGKCVSEGLIQKVLNWFRRMFGG
ncbi:hypothetical protein FJZ19_03895 [Candidatus Pacearchaeota archaeon]|nr:hypothetical protein [Candidatus Pacearchaeota archaeon]